MGAAGPTYFGGVVSTNGLVAYWRLDESSDGSGAVQRNDSWGTNHLTDNATVASAAGVITNAADIETGNTEYLSRADTPDVSMPPGTSFTICGWVNTESTGTRILIGKGSGSGANTEYAIFWVIATGDVSFRVGDGAAATATATVAGKITSTATWYFIAARCDLAADTLYLSVNAGTNATASYTGDTHDGTGAMEIGRAPWATSTRMDGIIDEVSMWKTVLTTNDIDNLYNGGAGRTL